MKSSRGNPNNNALIDFNNTELYKAYCLFVAECISAQPCQTLRDVELRYSFLTGMAVRHCQLLIDQQQIDSLVNTNISVVAPGYPVLHFAQKSQAALFTQKLSDFKLQVCGHDDGIFLSKVNYHGRKFCVRAVFCGRNPSFFDPEHAQRNLLSGAVNFRVFERGKNVGEVRCQRVFLDKGVHSDELVAIHQSEGCLSQSGSQVFYGHAISQKDIEDRLLGHFLHQLLVEVFDANKLSMLDLCATHSHGYVTRANGFLLYGKDDPSQLRAVIDRQNHQQSLIREDQFSVDRYFLDRDQLARPLVYFMDSIEPTSWQQLIAKNPIFAESSCILWPDFKGVKSTPERITPNLTLAKVSCDDPMSFEGLVRIGRHCLNDTLQHGMSAMTVFRDDCCIVDQTQEVASSLRIAQMVALMDVEELSLSELLTKAYDVDRSGQRLCEFFNWYLDAVVSGDLLLDEYSDEGLDGNGFEKIGRMIEVYNQLLSALDTNPQSNALLLAKALFKRRFEAYEEEIFEQEPFSHAALLM